MSTKPLFRVFALVLVMALLLPTSPARASLLPQAVNPTAPTITTDQFGYTMDDSEPLNWIDTSAGTNLSILRGAAAIDLPFTFKYYENAYDRLYLTLNGYLSFTNF